MRINRALLVGALIAIASRDAVAQNFTSTRTDCSGLQLYAAQGVPTGPTHGYRFRGICRELEEDEGTLVRVRWEGWVELESRYDPKTATLIEAASVKMSGHSDGPPSGTVQLVLRCAQDPMLTPAKCTIIQSAAKAPWPDFVTAWLNGNPFTKGKVTLALASSLSAQASTGNPPPPPPAPKEAGPTLQTLGKVLKESGSGSAATRQGVVNTVAARPPSVRPAPVEIPLASGARIALREGRSVVAQELEGSLRWMILDKDAVVLRTFPSGSRALRSAGGEILIDWGGGTFNAGPEQPTRRLTLPR
jgi:hypothetical protein